MKNFVIYSVNESMLTISLGDSIDTKINRGVFKLYDQLIKNRHSSWLDIIPAYTTVSVLYDLVSIRKNHASAFEWMKEQIEKLIHEIPDDHHVASRHVQVPVCYDPEFALDADRIMREKNLSAEEIVTLHTSKTYHVFMIGFLPGFAYMGSVDSRLATPRIPTPRTRVLAGSVGVAGEQTGIYPLDSPGGWNIIGRTPLKIFDPFTTEPVLLQPGDEVTFVPITRKEFDSFDPPTFNFINA